MFNSLTIKSSLKYHAGLAARVGMVHYISNKYTSVYEELIIKRVWRGFRLYILLG